MKDMKEIYLDNLHRARVCQGKALARLMQSRRRDYGAECVQIDLEMVRFNAECVRYWSSLIRKFCR